VQAYRGDIDAMWNDIVSENRTLTSRMTTASRARPWLASPLPRFGVAPANAWPARVIPIGNAAAALEPIGGEGIGLAMRSAQLAACEVIVAADEGRDVDVRGLHRQFDQLWRVRTTRLSRRRIPAVQTPAGGLVGVVAHAGISCHRLACGGWGRPHRLRDGIWRLTRDTASRPCLRWSTTG